MSGTASVNAFSVTGHAVRRVIAGCFVRGPVVEPEPAHIARLAIASVVIPLWVAAASLSSQLFAGSPVGLAPSIAALMKLFVLQSLTVVPIIFSMRSLREIGALGGNGALPDFALVLHLSGGVALGLDAGSAGAGAAAIALQQTVVYILSILMIMAAAGRGVVAASPVLVAAGVLSATIPPCIVVVARAGTALALYVSGFPASADATARRIGELVGECPSFQTAVGWA